MNVVSEINNEKVRQFIEAVWNQGHLELIDELVAADYIGRLSCGESSVVGPEGVRQLVSARRRTCPALYIKVQDQLAEEDRVVVRWRATTTPDRSPAEVPGTGRVQCCEGISIVRLVAGKQVDSHTQYSQFVSAGTSDLRDGLRPVQEASPPSSQ